jgi:hypothetical protein
MAFLLKFSSKVNGTASFDCDILYSKSEMLWLFLFFVFVLLLPAPSVDWLSQSLWAKTTGRGSSRSKDLEACIFLQLETNVNKTTTDRDADLLKAGKPVSSFS